jgi:hypothetical protein
MLVAMKDKTPSGRLEIHLECRAEERVLRLTNEQRRLQPTTRTNLQTTVCLG